MTTLSAHAVQGQARSNGAPPWILTYGFAILSTTFFVLLKLRLDGLLGADTPLLLIFTAVMLTAWFGGIGPGSVATLFSLVAIDFLFLHTRAFLPLNYAQDLRLGAFALEGVLVSFLSNLSHQASRHLSENAAMQRTLLQAQSDLGEGVIVIEDQKVIHINEAAQRISGYEASYFVTLDNLLSVIVPDERLLLLSRLQRRMLGEPVEDFYETAIINRDSQRLSLEMAVKMLQFKKTTYLIVLLRDITEKKLEEKRRRQSEEHYRLLIENVRDYAIFTLKKNGEIASWNEGAERIMGYEETEIIGRSFSYMFAPEVREAGMPEDLLRRAIEEGRAEEESWHVKKDGSRFFASGTITPLLTEKGQLRGFIKVMRDITERKLNEDRIHHQAQHDSLTGLPNRAMLRERLDSGLAAARLEKQRLALFFLDLDQFKNINDTLGHGFGDAILKQVATRLQTCVRSQDMVARLGGDEFTILLPRIKADADPIQVAGKVFAALKAPFAVDGHELHVNTSIGITTFPEDGHDAATLLRNADIALYQAKAQGRNSYQLFSSSMNQQATHRVGIENDLRHALSHHELFLQYQPIVDMATRQVASLEALVRWNHPRLGLVSPADFIPIAEESGLIIELNEWVLTQVCQQIRAWHTQSFSTFKVSVNLSPRQFTQKDFMERIRQAIAEGGVDANRLAFEITENSAMQNIPLTVDRLQELQKEGIQIMIDDFGTGHSSLNYLKQLPADALKIDKSFVSDCTGNAQDGAIIRAIIAMAHSLNLRVVAEGVETAEQLAFLSSLHCDAVQGFLLSRPVHPRDINEHATPAALASLLPLARAGAGLTG